MLIYCLSDAGRPFLSLCSLVDHRLSGVITREVHQYSNSCICISCCPLHSLFKHIAMSVQIEAPFHTLSSLSYFVPFYLLTSLSSLSSSFHLYLQQELMHTAKMMECNVTLQELTALKEIIPRAFPMGSEGEYVVNYVELNEVLTNHSPRSDSAFERNPFTNMNSTTGGRRDTDRETPRDTRDRDRDPYITSRSMSALPTSTPLWGARGTTLIPRSHNLNQSQYLDSRKQSLDASRMSMGTPAGYLSGPSPVYGESRGRGDDRNVSSSSSRGLYGRDADRDDDGGVLRGRDRGEHADE